MSKYRKRSELARFLAVPPEEIDRMMAEDGLPHRRLPGRNKPAIRFRLREVWDWLKKWAPPEVKVESFRDFEREFEEAQSREAAQVPSAE